MLASSGDGGGFIQFLLIAGFIIFALLNGGRRRRGRGSGRPPQGSLPRRSSAPPRLESAPSNREGASRRGGPRRHHDDLESVVVHDRLSPGDAVEDPRWLAGLDAVPESLETLETDDARVRVSQPEEITSGVWASEGATQETKQSASTARVVGLTPANARQAMLWHEILAPPLVLRR